MRSCDDAIPAFKDHHPPLDIIEIKHAHVFKFQQGLEVKLNARPECKLLRITTFSIVFGLDKESYSRISGKVRVDFGKKLGILCVTQAARKPSEDYPSRSSHVQDLDRNLRASRKAMGSPCREPH